MRAIVSAALVWAAAAGLARADISFVEPPPRPAGAPAPSFTLTAPAPVTEAACEDGAVPVEHAELLSFVMGQSPAQDPARGPLGSSASGTEPLTFAFRLTPGGRPLDLKVSGIDPRAPLTADTLEPLSESLLAQAARWRFAAVGRERRGCTVTVGLTRTPLLEGPADQLFQILSKGQLLAAPIGRLVRDHLAPASARCESRQPLRTNYPDFGKVRLPDKRDWVALRYDLAANGSVAAARIEASSGNDTLNISGLGALRRMQRTAGEAVSGCLWMFWTAPDWLPAPHKPRVDTAPGCLDTIASPAQELAPFWPRAFQRRRVAGWARVRFALAPWGATGAAEVIEAQPAAAFGEAAKRLVQSRRAPPSPAGASGCETLVVFAATPGDPGADAALLPPYPFP